MDKISYVVWWLERVAVEMVTKPTWYHHCTHINYSGGLTGWESYIDDLYFRPEGLEEHLLQGQVHRCMLEALDSALSQAEQQSSVLKLEYRLNVAEAYRIACMVSRRDPLVSANAKVRLNHLCARLNGGTTLYQEARRGFEVLIMARQEYCLEW